MNGKTALEWNYIITTTAWLAMLHDGGYQWLEHGSGNSFLVCPWTKNKSMISSRVMLAVSVGKLVFSVITSLNSL